MPDLIRYARLGGPAFAPWARLDGERAELLDRAPWDGGRGTGEVVALASVSLECPVLPGKIFGIGKNYRAHATEMGGDVPTEPLVFEKARSSLLGPGGTVILPKESARVDYEAELGVVIGKRCRRVPVDRALEHVLGYSPVCDVTARDFQLKDGQWTRAKGFDTFCPVGPVITCGLDATSLDIVLRLNGEKRQHASTAQMVFDVARIVSHVSSFATLEPGDLIATGTPDGVGPLSSGDLVEIVIEQLGTLTFRVARED